MKQSTNITTQIFLILVLALIMFTGNYSEEDLFTPIGGFNFVPPLFLGLLAALNGLEYVKTPYPVKTKPYIRSVVLGIIIIFILTSIPKGISVVNNSILFMTLFYLLFAIYFAFTTLKQEKNYDDKLSKGEKISPEKSENKPLEPGVFSRKQMIVTNIVIIVLPIIIISLGVIFLPSWFKLLGALIGLLGLVLGAFILAYINNKRFKRIIVLFEDKLDYASIDKEFSRFEAGNLHPDTRNLLRIIRANYLALIDKKKAMKLYEQYITPLNPPGNRLIAEQIEISFLCTMEMYDSMFTKIEALPKEHQNKKNVASLIDFLDSIIMAYKVKKEGYANSDALDKFQISSTSSIQKVFNSIIIASYYSNLGNQEKLDEILSDSKAYFSKLPEYEKILTKICTGK